MHLSNTIKLSNASPEFVYQQDVGYHVPPGTLTRYGASSFSPTSNKQNVVDLSHPNNNNNNNKNPLSWFPRFAMMWKKSSFQRYTPKKKNKSKFTPEKWVGLEDKPLLSFWGPRPIFRCYDVSMLVSGRVVSNGDDLTRLPSLLRSFFSFFRLFFQNKKPQTKKKIPDLRASFIPNQLFFFHISIFKISR